MTELPKADCGIARKGQPRGVANQGDNTEVHSKSNEPRHYD